MSAYWLQCRRCGTNYIGGVVGSTPWPEHVCPDGTRGAMADFTSPPTQPVAEKAGQPSQEKEPFDSR